MTIKSLNLWLTGKKYDQAQALGKSSIGHELMTTTMTMMVDDHLLNLFIHLSAHSVDVWKKFWVGMNVFLFGERVGCCVWIVFHLISIYFHQNELEMYDFFSFIRWYDKSDGKNIEQENHFTPHPINEI